MVLTPNHNQMGLRYRKKQRKKKRKTKRKTKLAKSVATTGFVFVIDVTIEGTGNIRRTNVNCVESFNADNIKKMFLYCKGMRIPDHLHRKGSRIRSSVEALYPVRSKTAPGKNSNNKNSNKNSNNNNEKNTNNTFLVLSTVPQVIKLNNHYVPNSKLFNRYNRRYNNNLLRIMIQQQAQQQQQQTKERKKTSMSSLLGGSTPSLRRSTSTRRSTSAGPSGGASRSARRSAIYPPNI